MGASGDPGSPRPTPDASSSSVTPTSAPSIASPASTSVPAVTPPPRPPRTRTRTRPPNLTLASTSASSSASHHHPRAIQTQIDRAADSNSTSNSKPAAPLPTDSPPPLAPGHVSETDEDSDSEEAGEDILRLDTSPSPGSPSSSPTRLIPPLLSARLQGQGQGSPLPLPRPPNSAFVDREAFHTAREGPAHDERNSDREGDRHRNRLGTGDRDRETERDGSSDEEPASGESGDLERDLAALARLRASVKQNLRLRPIRSSGALRPPRVKEREERADAEGDRTPGTGGTFGAARRAGPGRAWTLSADADRAVAPESPASASTDGYFTPVTGPPLSALSLGGFAERERERADTTTTPATAGASHTPRPSAQGQPANPASPRPAPRAQPISARALAARLPRPHSPPASSPSPHALPTAPHASTPHHPAGQTQSRRPLLIDARPLAAHHAHRIRGAVPVAVPSLLLKRSRRTGSLGLGSAAHGGGGGLHALRQFVATERGRRGWDRLFGLGLGLVDADGGFAPRRERELGRDATGEWDGTVVVCDEEMDGTDAGSGDGTGWALVGLVAGLLHANTTSGSSLDASSSTVAATLGGEEGEEREAPESETDAGRGGCRVFYLAGGLARAGHDPLFERLIEVGDHDAASVHSSLSSDSHSLAQEPTLALPPSSQRPAAHPQRQKQKGSLFQLQLDPDVGPASSSATSARGEEGETPPPRSPLPVMPRSIAPSSSSPSPSSTQAGLGHDGSDSHTYTRGPSGSALSGLYPGAHGWPGGWTGLMDTTPSPPPSQLSFRRPPPPASFSSASGLPRRPSAPSLRLAGLRTKSAERLPKSSLNLGGGARDLQEGRGGPPPPRGPGLTLQLPSSPSHLKLAHSHGDGEGRIAPTPISPGPLSPPFFTPPRSPRTPRAFETEEPRTPRTARPEEGGFNVPAVPPPLPLPMNGSSSERWRAVNGSSPSPSPSPSSSSASPSPRSQSQSLRPAAAAASPASPGTLTHSDSEAEREEGHHAFTVSTILPGFLFLGPEPSERAHVAELRRRGVRRIVNLAAECGPDDWGLDLAGGPGSGAVGEHAGSGGAGFEQYRKIPMRDTVEEDAIARGVREVCEILDDARLHSAPTYVHCKAGKSRSVTAVIAYLIHANHWPLGKAYQFVVDRRRGISPNIGFVSELMGFEEERLGRAAKYGHGGHGHGHGHGPASASVDHGAGGYGAHAAHGQQGEGVGGAANGYGRGGAARESLPPHLSLSASLSSTFVSVSPSSSSAASFSSLASTSSASSASSTDMAALVAHAQGTAGQDVEVKDASGRYRHARRAPVDENTLQPMRRVSKAGLESTRDGEWE